MEFDRGILSRVVIVLFFFVLAHLSRMFKGELIQCSIRLVRCPSVYASTLSNMNISETCGSMGTRFNLKHLWDGGKGFIRFWPDRIRTMVSMPPLRLIWGKRCLRVFPGVLVLTFSIFAGSEGMHQSLNEFRIRPDQTTDYIASCH